MHLFMALAFFAAAAPQAVVLKPVANMYAQPSDDTEVVSQAIYGTNVGVVDARPGWLHVRTPDDYTGWVRISDLRLLAAGEPPYASQGRVARVESLFANIYREPNVTRQRPQITVPFETHLEVTAEAPDNTRWLKVRLPDYDSGWLQAGDVSFDTEPLSMDAAIALSRRFLGLPYTWGGASSFGFDCSGFTQTIYRRRGVLMPRDADKQAAWDGLVAVKRQDLAPGDLLFFGSNADHITHTGMYLGDNKFINATTWIRPVIQICDLTDPHWAGLLVACRRLK